ncbi:MAG TPA: substrate-binding domain-containing protein [Rhodothermales bacterium]|nr:substrate-binding domain-containing protein [Rhodothermales bacterium]HRR08323.1 substrate-binding domain-containing protein [Rhodothermales bacterium]
MKQIRWTLFLITLAVIGCTDRNDGVVLDTMTSGKIKIVVDESYKPIFETQLDVFHSDYPDAKITPLYLSETEMMNKFLASDSFHVAISSRELTPQEKQYFEKIKVVPITTKIAKDAIALVIHPSMGEVKLTVGQLKEIFSGKIRSWSGVGAKGGDLRVVFDNPNSSSARYVSEQFTGGAKLPDNIFATKQTSDVLTYVSQNPGVLGVIGVNWISDLDDPTNPSFTNKVEVVAVAKSEGEEYFKPYQAYIARKDYPLTREVHVISREGRNGLGKGFSFFTASDKGQRIILKSGLVPATAPLRLIKAKNESPY